MNLLTAAMVHKTKPEQVQKRENGQIENSQNITIRVQKLKRFAQNSSALLKPHKKVTPLPHNEETNGISKPISSLIIISSSPSKDKPSNRPISNPHILVPELWIFIKM
ncbi:hypothetical protein QQP08_017085 [Theobroma cacao]|uniref:Uncharacterized protein n=1 Tax=Theobroma cacao TaxID=3641 RepID=A0A061EWD2_THECC|nr:Uncharacterized protein TCM_024295 [Theobroma cacao]WRX24598.1 hypothetical protein QQP08_017085 [Theobroma cacao]